MTSGSAGVKTTQATVRLAFSTKTKPGPQQVTVTQCEEHAPR